MTNPTTAPPNECPVCGCSDTYDSDEGQFAFVQFRCGYFVGPDKDGVWSIGTKECSSAQHAAIQLRATVSAQSQRIAELDSKLQNMSYITNEMSSNSEIRELTGRIAALTAQRDLKLTGDELAGEMKSNESLRAQIAAGVGAATSVSFNLALRALEDIQLEVERMNEAAIPHTVGQEEFIDYYTIKPGAFHTLLGRVRGGLVSMAIVDLRSIRAALAATPIPAQPGKESES